MCGMLTSKDIVLQTLAFKETFRSPVMPHWWGLYKFELAGLVNSYEQEHIAWEMNGSDLATVDDIFYNKFSPDILHLSAGCSKLHTDPKWGEYLDELCIAIKKFNSFSIIDEFCQHIYCSKEKALDCGKYSHVSIHARNHPDAFLAMNEGNPVGTALGTGGYIDFEDSYIALLEHPKEMEYFIQRLYNDLIPQMEALHELGADAYIGSETMCSADLISPKLYRDIIFPAQQQFYKKINDIGLIPMAYFTGNIMPLLDSIENLHIRALLIEEDKKGYGIKLGKICKRLHGNIAVFGNIDGISVMLKGTPEDVRREVFKQLDEAGSKGFVVSCGSPLAFHTPRENVHALKNAVEEYLCLPESMKPFAD